MSENQQHVKTSDIARRLNISRRTVTQDIIEGKLSAFKTNGGGRGTYLIKVEDAETYATEVRRGGIDHHKSVYAPENQSIKRIDKSVHEEQDIPVHDLCDCCGARRGNILGDIDEFTKKQYGYLCMKCHRLIHSFQGDLSTMRNVITYIEKTRQSQV